MTWIGLCNLALKTMKEKSFLYQIGEDYRILFKPYFCNLNLESLKQLTTNDLATEYFKYVSVYKRK